MSAGAVQQPGVTGVQHAIAARTFAVYAGSKNMASVEAAAKDFESMFMAQMLQPVWEGVEVDGVFGGGHGEEIMRIFLIQELGKSIAQGMNTGISDAIKAEMIRIQASQQSGFMP